MRKKISRKIPETDRKCDFPGCQNAGLHKAPKDRNLQSYYWFCLEHVREYNKNWNFYSGLSADEIERHLQHDITWQRPTWKLGHCGIKSNPRVKDRFKVLEDAGLGMDGRYTPPPPPQLETQLIVAAQFMELTLPIRLTELKKQYKKLAKKYHPDTHPNDDSAARNFQKLTESYQCLLKYLNP